jgi:hypothetical protein
MMATISSAISSAQELSSDESLNSSPISEAKDGSPGELFEAISLCNPNHVKALVAAGASPNAVDEQGNPAIAKTTSD